MKCTALVFLAILLTNSVIAQQKDDFIEIEINQEITEVQPMTGVVFWQDSHTNTDAISLEFSYMLYNDVVTDSGVYNWDVVEEKLNDIASRNHQAVFRFRDTYVGRQTSVPEYIKALPDYHETMGLSEGRETWFSDWRHDELKRFILEFNTEFASHYDNDPRLAFVQVGFGLWAEYHIYDGPFQLGVTFPDKEFQTAFFHHIDSVWQNKFFSISIDAADDTYSPFDEHPELLNIRFGLFDDSFMSDSHSGYNESCWNFFDRNRFKIAPAGGEFNYYTNYDQQHVLDWPYGAHGESFESFSARFHISYMIGADQPDYQTMERIKEASMATGYRFKIVSFRASADSSVVQIINEGDAPIYYDAWPTANGVRAVESLKYLQDDEIREFHISSGGSNPVFTIESDAILSTQTIGYYGTLNSHVYENQKIDWIKIYPNQVAKGNAVHLKTHNNQGVYIEIYELSGRAILSTDFKNEYQIVTSDLHSGMYFVKVTQGSLSELFKIVII